MLVLMIEIVKGSRQNECLTNFAQRDAFRRIAERGLKAFDGLPEWLETEPERLMMHGHDKFRTGSGWPFQSPAPGVQWFRNHGL